MSNKYTPTKWVARETIGTASVMNNIEQGIFGAYDEIEKTNTEIVKINENLSNVNSELSHFEVITIDNVGGDPITILDTENRTGIYLIFLAGEHLDTPKSLYVATFVGNYGNFVTPLSIGNGIAGFVDTSLEAQISGKTVTIKRSGSSTRIIPRVHCHVYKVLY